jgi:serine/threonine protein kinase
MTEPNSPSPENESNVRRADNEQLAEILREGLSSASGIPEIVILHGGVEIARCPLGHSPLRIGRGGESDIALDDKMVSRNHAEIVRTDDGWVIRDLGSRHKIRFGGRQYDAHLFKDGDGVGLGPYELVFQEIPRAIAHDRVMGSGGPTRPAPDSKPLDVQTEPEPPAALQIPGYRLVREIGRGGMGRVFEAYQLSTKRRVALKVLLDGPFSTAQARGRFEREVVIVAGLRHGNIAQVYESGLHEGLYWFAMEFVDGRPIDVVVREDGYSPAATVQLMIKVCDAIGYAHEQGVIHRDLSPRNILVSSDGEPHVVDFGLAKVLSARLDGESTISLRGDLLGTPAYMSPEQTSRQPDSVDARTDVYSLGVVLYRLVTGSYPYRAQGRLDEIIKEIATADPKPPRSQSDSVSAELEAILFKTLEKDPDDRYPDAKALGEDLQRMLADQPVAAMAGRRSYWWRHRWKKGRSLGVAAVGLAALFLIVILMAVPAGEDSGRSNTASTDDSSADATLNGQASDPVELLQQIEDAVVAERWLAAREALGQFHRLYGETDQAERAADRLAHWDQEVAARQSEIEAEKRAVALLAQYDEAKRQENLSKAQMLNVRLLSELGDTQAVMRRRDQLEEDHRQLETAIQSELARREREADMLLDEARQFVDQGNFVQADIVLQRLTSDFEDTRAVQSAPRKLEGLLRAVRLAMGKGDVVETDTHFIDRSFKRTPAWQHAEQQAANFMESRTYQKDPKKVMMPRFFVEDENLEPRFAVTARNGWTWSCCWGWSRMEGIENGGFVLTTPRRAWNGGPIEYVIDALYHYNPTVRLHFGGDSLTLPGEITAKRIPPELTGTLIVRFQPEPGVSLRGGTLYLSRESYRNGVKHCLDNAEPRTFTGIGEGNCTIKTRRKDRFHSTLVQTDILPGQTSEVTVPVFALRRVEMSYRFRVSPETESWRDGVLRTTTSDSWHAGDEWGLWFPVFKISDWTDQGAGIEDMNSRMRHITNEEYEAGVFPGEEAWRLRAHSYSLQVGACFAIKDNRDDKWQGLIRVENIEPILHVDESEQ